MQLYAIHLAGGGSDLACRKCLPEAKAERGSNGDGSLISIAPMGETSEYCVYCGIDGGRDS